MKKFFFLALLAVLTLSAFAQNPPRNLTVEAQDNTAILQWEEPREAGVLYWHVDDLDSAFSYGSTSGEFARFTPTDLADFDGETLQSVEFFAYDLSCTTTLQVWTGGSGGTSYTPGTLASEQQVSVSSQGMLSVTLNTPVTIDASQELWFGLKFTNVTTGFPHVYDIGPAVTGKGDIFFANNSYVAASNAFSDFDANFVIRGNVGSGRTLASSSIFKSKKADQVAPSNQASTNVLHTVNNLGVANYVSLNNSTREATSYNVYRDGVLAFTTDRTTAVYDTNLSAGTYYYHVTAVHGAEESESTELISVTIEPTPIVAPTALAANVVNVNNVYLDWDMPGNNPGIESLYWDNDEIEYSVSWGNKFRVAQRFTSEQLQQFDGQYLTKVSYLAGGESCYKIVVWTGGSWNTTSESGNPGTVAITQWDIDSAPDQWNVVSLKEPVLIDADEELWIGYEVNGAVIGSNSGYPACTDVGPAINTYGNLLSTGSGLTSTFSEGPDTYGNFMLRGYVASSISSAPTATNASRNNRSFTSYKVYRDSELLATVTNPEYTFYYDTFVPEGDHSYTVTALYDEGESSASPSADVNIGEIPILPPTGLAAINYNINKIQLSWNQPNASNAQELLGWDNSEVGDNVLRFGAQFNIAQRYTSEDLADYDGWTLSYISFLPIEAGDFRVRVWQGGSVNETDNTATPGTMLVDQVIESVTLNEWNQVLLYTPVEIDADQELWIGIMYDGTVNPDAFPCVTDAGPGVAWKGDLIGRGANPGNFERIANIFADTENPIDANILVHGWLSDTTESRTYAKSLAYNTTTTAPMPAELCRATRNFSVRNTTRALDGYNVYRDGDLLTTLNSPTTMQYLDEGSDGDGLAAGDYNYYVTAIYGDTESDPSQTIQASVVFPAPEAVNVMVTGSDPYNAIIRWTAPSGGIADSYNIYSNNSLLGNTTNAYYPHSNIDATRYDYYVTAVYGDFESNPSNHVVIENFEVDGEDLVNPVKATVLGANVPNPFNPTTEISFATKEAGNVTLTVYNLLGQKVKTLANGQYAAGNHKVVWEGNDDNGNKVASGVYLYKMKSGRYTSTKKMILMK